MPTDEYIVIAAFEAEIEKISKKKEKPKKSTLAQDFVGGIDPFGTYTSSFGQRAEQAGVSKGEHRKKRAVSVAGGLLGGAVLLPAAVMGTASASKALALGPRAMAKAFRRGAVKPFKTMASASTAHRGLKRIKKTKGGGKLTKKETKALKRTIGKTPLQDAVSEIGRKRKEVKPDEVARTKKQRVKDFVKRLRKSGGTEKIYLRRKEAKHLDEPIRKELRSGTIQLGIGGTVGALGADVQYRKGQQAERGFQRRLKAAREAR